MAKMVAVLLVLLPNKLSISGLTELEINLWPIHRLLNKELHHLAEQEHAAHATVDQLDHLAAQVAMEVMAVTDNLVNPENVVTQLHLNHRSSTDSPNNAHAKPHQANKDQQDPKAQMDQPEMVVPQDLMANQATKDHEAHQAKMEKPEMQDRKDQQENLARPHQKLVLQALQEAQAKLVHQVLQVNPVVLAKMAAQAVQVAQEKLEHQEAMENQAQPAQMEIKASKETQEAAPTAHQLAWLQDIKYHPDFHSSLQEELKIKHFNAFIVVFLGIFNSVVVRRCKNLWDQKLIFN